jgi:hypothetical protein
VGSGTSERLATIVLRWDPPDAHDTDPHIVSVPLHDSVSIRTLRSIAESAGAKDFDAFCRWVDVKR